MPSNRCRERGAVPVVDGAEIARANLEIHSFVSVLALRLIGIHALNGLWLVFAFDGLSATGAKVGSSRAQIESSRTSGSERS